MEKCNAKDIVERICKKLEIDNHQSASISLGEKEIVEFMNWLRQNSVIEQIAALSNAR